MNSDFSLTKTCVIETINSIYAYGDSGEGNVVIPFVITKVIAAVASFFALSDALLHFGLGCYELGVFGKRVLLGKVTWLVAASAATHFVRSLQWIALTPLASLVSLIHLKWLQYDLFPSYHAPIFNLSYNNSEEFYKQANAEGLLKEAWTHTPSSLRREIIEKVFYHPSEESESLKKLLSPIVYRKIVSKRNSASYQVHVVASSSFEASRWDLACFYHCTNDLSILKKILQSKQIKVMASKKYRGAFISTVPEFKDYGSYSIVFKRSIEHLPLLCHINPSCIQPRYWAGFAESIPIREDSVVGILLKEGVEITPQEETAIKEAAGWDIPIVKTLSNPQNRDSFATLPVTRKIPVAWPQKEVYCF